MNNSYLTMDLSKEQKIDFLKTMLVSRHGDLREQRLIRQGKGWFQVSGMGHEAIGAATLHLNDGDYCFPFYRDRAFVVGRGVSNYDLALAFYAKKQSSSAGRQLPAHYSNRKLNIWSVLSPISAHLLPACGAAWGMQMDGKNNVLVTSVGDGGTRQGDFYEAVCFAKEKKLPMVFIVQDNKYAISTKTEHMHALAIDALPKEDWSVIDGASVDEVYDVTKKAVDKGRNGDGPSFIWAKVDRLSSHSSADDHRSYRTEEDIKSMYDKNDPVARYTKALLDEGVITQEEVDQLDAEIQAQVREDYIKAETAADPRPGDEFKQVFGPFGIGQAPTLEAGKEYRMADAINHAFKEALETNKDTCFFGEDIEDPLGGVFRLTKGLSENYPGRVVNSPLAESSIIGIASGLASYGKKPIFEIQFIDFISPGWNQLVNNLGNLRWRSNGDWTCPAIIYAPCGAYLPGGALWHSQTNEGAFAHCPGIIILMPSTPEDAAGLLSTALACDDPVLFLIPKHMLWASKTAPKKAEPIPLGKAAIRHEGSDVTLVAWGNCLEVAEKALEKFGKSESVELIDLRSIVPWDRETISNSVKKTGRLIVVQEDSRTCSIGQTIISSLTEDASVWGSMIAPPELVSKGDIHVGFNPIIEYASIPDVDRILQALQKVLSTSSARHGVTTSAISSPSAGSDWASESVVDEPVAGEQEHIVKLPNLGEGLREARIIEVFKKEGDTVAQDDPLCEVETDKAVFPVESAVEGVISKWLVKEDDLVEVGQDLVSIQAKGGVSQSPSDTNGAGSSGHITIEHGALSPEIIRQLEGVLPAALGVVAEWKPLREARSKVRGRSKGGVFSYTTMVAWSVVKALEEFPAFRRLLRNGQISDPQDEFDMGFAVALEDDELETAVIPKANTLSWPEFVSAYREGVRKAKEGASQSKARTSIVLTSMGPLKIRTGKPIVVPPATATLFLGEPYFEVLEDGKTREVVSLDLCFDHRWANGAGAGRFLKQVKDNIENFDISVLE